MEHKWFKITDNKIPDDAFRGGYDGLNALFVARAKDNQGNVVGGKASSSLGCSITYDGREVNVKDYEILAMSPYKTINYIWVYSKQSRVPEGAVCTDDAGYYVARVAYNNTITPGRYKSGNDMAYIAYAGSESSSRNYEILCYKEGEVSPHTSA